MNDHLRKARLKLLSVLYPDLTMVQLERVDELASVLPIDDSRNPNATLRIEYVIPRELAERIYEDALTSDIVESNFKSGEIVYLELKSTAAIAPPESR